MKTGAWALLAAYAFELGLGGALLLWLLGGLFGVACMLFDGAAAGRSVSTLDGV
jgi:hypothetical protein